jgi:hypothetical protein
LAGFAQQAIDRQQASILARLGKDELESDLFRKINDSWLQRLAHI